jgi:nucleoside-diphosphate-sugar epimerase
VSRKTAALTGGTGFLGRYIIQALARDGWNIRLLARRAPLHPMLADIPLELVLGDLDNSEALSRLVDGADAVIHCAALVKARNRAEFFAANEGGASRLARICASNAPSARFILISSQAAREPALSAYASSKRAGEVAVAAALGSGPWAVLRPCVIYGPWDAEGVALLRLASGWIAPVPRQPEARIAIIHARDVAAAVAALSAGGPAGKIFELSDECPQGYGWSEILGKVANAIGRAPSLVPVPDALFHLAGALSEGVAALRARPVIFSRDKAREILHRNWQSDLSMRLPGEIWAPQVSLDAGIAQTAAWWREMGLL